MPNLSYSTEARNVLNLFHRTDKIVYVEGDDDICFWEIVLSEVSSLSFKIEPTGGKNELKKLINESREGTAEYWIAMDSDYDYLLNVSYQFPVIRTYGYSIENTFICPLTLSSTLRKLIRNSDKRDILEYCKDWVKRLENQVSLLIYCDILSSKEGLGVAVLPDASDRFMKGKSYELCEDNITNFISNLGMSPDDEKITEVIDLIASKNHTLIDLVRGHFLFSACMRFVKLKTQGSGYSASISKEMFYTAIMAAFEKSFNPNHPHFIHYKTQVDKFGFS